MADGDGAGARVRLAHEALLTHWERARRQIAQDRDDLRTRAVVEEALAEYRGASAARQGKYLLHAFVLMPDHFHLLITPTETLERALQLIKGGFSFRARKELGFGGEIWQTSFYDRRVRDLQEYSAFREYIHHNPMKKGLAAVAEHYAYSSARPEFQLDGLPRRLKPCAAQMLPQILALVEMTSVLS